MKHYNYITTNLITKKQYVGARSTIKDINKDKYLGSGRLIKEAIKEFRKENFFKEILCKTKTRREADNNEGFYIKLYNTLNPNGYNINLKGGNGTGLHSEETKEKISKSLKGNQNPKGIKRTEESKRKQSKTLIGRKGWSLGLTKETDPRVKKMSISLKKIKI